MALLNLKFSSLSLGMDTSVNIILPEEKYGAPILEKYPVLYLLHGLGGDECSWIRKTSIERYAKTLGLIIVMPDAGRSFYTDMNYGYNYFTYISSELPKYLKSFLPISQDRNDTFIAGLSMGGYGALKIGFTYPENFSVVGTLSGAADLRSSTISDFVRPDFQKEMINIFGDTNLDGTEHDIIHLIKDCEKDNKVTPLLYQFCGTEDYLYPMNTIFKSFIEKETNIELIYEEESAVHDWDIWDKKIVTFFKLLQERYI